MTNEELIKLYRAGSEEALNKIIENNDRLIHKLANKYSKVGKCIDIEDLLQCGYIGLINAVNRYKDDIDNPTKFITFAFLLVKQEMISYINGNSSKDKGNREINNKCVSIYAPLKNDEDSTLIDTIDSHDNSIENIEDKLYLEQLRRELQQAMYDNNTLTEREVLKLRYGWDIGPVAIDEISELLSIKYSKARSIEIKALRKLRYSVWGRTNGKQYRDEICGNCTCSSYAAVDRLIDEDIYANNVINKYFKEGL